MPARDTYDEVHVAGHLVAQADQVEDEVDADGEEGGQRDKLDPAVALVARVHDRANERDETQHLQGSACTALRETLIKCGKVLSNDNGSSEVMHT